MPIEVPASITSPEELLALNNELSQKLVINKKENNLTEVFSVTILSEFNPLTSYGTVYGAPVEEENAFSFARVRRPDVDAKQLPSPFLSKTIRAFKRLVNMHPIAILPAGAIQQPHFGDVWEARYISKLRKGLVLIRRTSRSGTATDELSKSPIRDLLPLFPNPDGNIVGNYGSPTAADIYAGVIIKGSVYPGDPITSNQNIKPNEYITTEYLPAFERALPSEPNGLKLLATAMAIKEGFYPNTRSYRYNNPGNIGNTDSGSNVGYPTLEDGIKKQKNYLLSVANGTHGAYSLGKTKKMKSYYSKEIAENQKTYKKSPYLPGYEFVYTGQLDQFVKIYATSSRSSNAYLNLILSYFKQNGIVLTPQSKIQDIIKM